MSYVRLSGLLAVAGFAVACGGAPVPQDRLTAAEAAVSAAEAGGAHNVPKAQLHLKQAREGIAEAKALIADDENERANEVLKLAEVDAELSLALAREGAVKAEAQEAVDEVAKLKGSGK
jgi:hypothetical protein